ncbi:MAG: DUF5915 domain-containing protein [Prevotellaceae bacterium]|jgi:isoleucyl-tRNA synthetase|nr:DUF5915 domain-containing protein [Prevotellaceae bacterium]
MSSVHLTDFPKADESLIDKNLEECMSLAQQISSMILALRRKADKKVRQPLLKAVVPASDEKTFSQINYIADLIRSEVNIKELQVLAPDVEMENIVKRIKPNFKTLGKKYGKFMKEIAAAFANFDKKTVSEIEKSEKYVFALSSGENIELESGDYDIFTEDMDGWLVANEGKLTVALDIEVTPELYREGIARELVNRIQNIRKSSGYEIVDKISVKILQSENLNSVIADYGNYIAAQVLANEIICVPALENSTELDFDEFKVNIEVEKI